MKELIMDIFNAFRKWFKSLKHWQRNLLIFMLVIVCISWVLVISDISEWWHWSQWQEHIRNE